MVKCEVELPVEAPHDSGYLPPTSKFNDDSLLLVLLEADEAVSLDFDVLGVGTMGGGLLWGLLSHTSLNKSIV